MTIQTFNALQYVPAPMQSRTTGAPGFGGLILDAAAEKVAVVFEAPKAGTLDKFEFRLQIVTQAPASGLRASFQSVDESAIPAVPDGTQDQYRDITSGLTANTWIVPGLMTSDGTDGGVKRTVTKGELLACVIEFVSWASGDNLRISTIDATGSGINELLLTNFPINYTFTTVWSAAANPIVIALKYDDGSYVAPHTRTYPYESLSTHTFNSGSTPDEIGVIWTPPVATRVCGCWFRADVDNAFDVVLYDTDGSSVLHTLTGVPNRRQAATGGGHAHLFSSAISLAAGSAYRLVMQPGASSVALYYGDTASAAIMAALDGGTALHQTSRTDAGSWTETTTRRPFLGFILDGFDDGAGGAGGGARGSLLRGLVG